MMADANGKPLMALVVQEPLNGRWSAHFAAQADSVSKLVTLTVGKSLTTSGVLAPASSAAYGSFVGTVLGGQGNPAAQVKPRFYRDTTVNAVLSDLVADAGERLSSRSPPAATGAKLDVWVTMAGSLGSALNLLCAHVGPGCVWRFLRDGTLLFGEPSWKSYEKDGANRDLAVTSRSPLERMVEVATNGDDDVLPQPGQTYEGKRISYAEHRLTGYSLRSKLYLEST